MRIERWRLLFFLALLTAAGCGCCCGRDYLNDFDPRAWSPDCDWLAFNWPQQDELFFISMKSGRSYLLKPVGPVELKTSNVFSSGPPSAAARHEAKIVPSWGLGKLTVLDWSPDSQSAAYQIGRENAGLFSLPDESVEKHFPVGTLLPWQSTNDLRFTLDLQTETGGRLAVQKRDGTLVKEVHFTDTDELMQISLARYHDADLFSNAKQFLLYPRYQADRWQLMLDPLATNAPARIQADLGTERPYGWKLTPDDRVLAVATKEVLRVGAVDDWAKARKFPLTYSSIAMSWSPDGRFLAYNANQSLYCLGPGADAAMLITTNCTQRFWGWRGKRLLFGDARSNRTDLYGWDSDTGSNAVQLVTARHWQTSPRYVGISPDGNTLACLISEFDGSGNAVAQLWKIALTPGAEWTELYTVP